MPPRTRSEDLKLTCALVRHPDTRTWQREKASRPALLCISLPPASVLTRYDDPMRCAPVLVEGRSVHAQSAASEDLHPAAPQRGCARDDVCAWRHHTRTHCAQQVHHTISQETCTQKRWSHVGNVCLAALAWRHFTDTSNAIQRTTAPEVCKREDRVYQPQPGPPSHSDLSCSPS